MRKLLIVVPLKTDPLYAERMVACKETWLRDVPVDGDAPDSPVHYKGFTDAELGLTEINQHDNANDPIRTWRTKLMVKYAYDQGYDFVFRVDTDAFCWINRLLACGFEQWDYMGWCDVVPNQTEWCRTTAHGGIGFFLSRKAMKVIVKAPIERYADGKYWGDLWCGQQLYKAGIRCHRDTRFIDGSHMPDHRGNVLAHELPLDHQFISIHPVNPCPDNFYAMRDRFPQLSDETIPPER